MHTPVTIIGAGLGGLTRARVLHVLSLILEGRQAMRVLDREGTVLFDKADDGTGGRPEVQRGELRQLLLDSLPAGTVPFARCSGVGFA